MARFQRNFALLLLFWSVPLLAREIPLLEIEGAIGPATVAYLSWGLEEAERRKAPLVIVRLDTPGGLEASMREIVKKIIAVPLPVVVYVAPSGSQAASAGTYILYAAHVAAMAPATTLGAATPVQLGGGEVDEALRKKVINDAASFLRGLAHLRGRNEVWAEKAVREGATLTAGEALKLGVIDLLARDLEELLQKLDGRHVEVLGQEVVLDTEGGILEKFEPNWRIRLLALLTNPNVAYLLMLLGVYGLLFEFSNPGAIVPGVLGAICLLLALYAFQILPVNSIGIALILLGIALMVAEAFVPSFGILGFGGVVAFIFGSLMLTSSPIPGFGLDPRLVYTTAVLSAVLLLGGLAMLLRLHRKPVAIGPEELVSEGAVALEDFEREGWVWVHGERWRAVTDRPVKRGAKLKVLTVEGLILKVTPEEEK